jgi:DNA-binding Lrp family transcriptional regulator
MPLDELDRQLIKQLSSGINSYEELARICGVTRNTVYRRIAALENSGIIKNTIRCAINLDKLGVVPICMGLRISQHEMDRAFNLLSAHKKIRLLWRSYGDHNVELVAFVQKGEEGETIHSIKAILECFEISNLDVSVGFVWEKSDFESFEGPPEIEKNIEEMLEKQD